MYPLPSVVVWKLMRAATDAADLRIMVAMPLLCSTWSLSDGAAPIPTFPLASIRIRSVGVAVADPVADVRNDRMPPKLPVSTHRMSAAHPVLNTLCVNRIPAKL